MGTRLELAGRLGPLARSERAVGLYIWSRVLGMMGYKQITAVKKFGGTWRYLKVTVRDSMHPLYLWCGTSVYEAIIEPESSTEIRMIVEADAKGVNIYTWHGLYVMSHERGIRFANRIIEVCEGKTVYMFSPLKNGIGWVLEGDKHGKSTGV